MAKHRGQIVNRKHSGGLGIAEYWTAQFARNEFMVQQGRYGEVYDDEQLKGVLAAAFPDRSWSEVMRQVKRVRAAYNRGKLTHGQIPEPRSYAYEMRDGTLCRLDGYGRLLEEFVPKKQRKAKRKVTMASGNASEGAQRKEQTNG